jgi:hypothetical protein
MTEWISAPTLAMDAPWPLVILDVVDAAGCTGERYRALFMDA